MASRSVVACGEARPGEDLILFGYEPRIGDGPYREIGAVFAHAAACEGPSADEYPEGFRGKPQVLRSYDRRGWIRDAVVHDGTNPESEIERLLADPSERARHEHAFGIARRQMLEASVFCQAWRFRNAARTRPPQTAGKLHRG